MYVCMYEWYINCSIIFVFFLSLHFSSFHSSAVVMSSILLSTQRVLSAQPRTESASSSAVVMSSILLSTQRVLSAQPRTVSASLQVTSSALPTQPQSRTVNTAIALYISVAVNVLIAAVITAIIIFVCLIKRYKIRTRKKHRMNTDGNVAYELRMTASEDHIYETIDDFKYPSANRGLPTAATTPGATCNAVVCNDEMKLEDNEAYVSLSTTSDVFYHTLTTQTDTTANSVSAPLDFIQRDTVTKNTTSLNDADTVSVSLDFPPCDAVTVPVSGEGATTHPKALDSSQDAIPDTGVNATTPQNEDHVVVVPLDLGVAVPVMATTTPKEDHTNALSVPLDSTQGDAIQVTGENITTPRNVDRTNAVSVLEEDPIQATGETTTTPPNDEHTHATSIPLNSTLGGVICVTGENVSTSPNEDHAGAMSVPLDSTQGVAAPDTSRNASPPNEEHTISVSVTLDSIQRNVC